MGVTADGHVFVAFVDTADDMAKISLWAGETSWTAPEVIVDAILLSNFDVATTGTNTIYVAFADNDLSKLRLLKYNGTLP